jgi:hypothetical protein
LRELVGLVTENQKTFVERWHEFFSDRT